MVPDRPGLATGMAIMGFGGGALIASPLSTQLLSWFDDGYNPADPKSAANAIHTPSFWLLWTVLLCNVTAGIGILEQASPMIQDFFREDGTSSVTVAVAGGFVGILSMANMAGRFVWSSTSDVVGRKPIYTLYLGGGMICYTLLALIGATSTGLFVLLAVVILSLWGRSTAGC
jgi:MFS family permease